MLAVLLGLGFPQVSAQQIVEVPGNGGTATNSYLPTYTYYNYSLTQQLYTPAEIGMPGTISSIAFYNSGTERTRSCDIYMVNTDKQSFSGSTDWIAVTADDLVFSGSVTFASGAWTTLALTNLFSYDGVSNLALVVDDNTGSYESSMSCYVFDATSMAIRVYNDYTNYDPTAPSGYSGAVLGVKNQIQLGITPGVLSCHPVSNVAASAITPTGAHLSWNASEDAVSYILQYKTSSQNWDDVSVLSSMDTTYDFTTELTPMTTYTVRVASLCGDGDTSVWRSASFMTACDAITISETEVWFEDFEGYTGGGEQPFNCWATPVTSSYGAPFVYCGYSSSCHSGQNSAELKGSSGDVNMLVLPEFTNDIHDLRLSFWATATSPSNGTLQVGVLADMDDLTSFEPIGLSGTPSSRNGVGNYMGPFDFNGVQASSGRLALRFTSNSYNLSWNLDDFTVEISPSCTSPVKTSVTATGIDGHNATVSFVDNDESHDSWTLYYKMDTESENSWQQVTLMDTFYTLTGLAPETTYNVYVVTNCGGVPSDDATLTYNFTTSVACPAPTAVTASPVYINDATITWTSTAAAFNVEYGEAGFSQGSGTTETVYDNTITLSNLTAQTSYTVYVQADCSGDNDGLSQWASVQFTTLPSCPAPTQVAATNITSNSADIVWTAGYQESEWELRYGPENFNPDTSSVSVIVTGSELFQMQNLGTDTRYDIYVRAICGAGDTSAWSSRITFKTQCEAAQLPLTENFDTYSDWSSPDCWAKFEAPNSGYVANGVYIYSETPYSGSRSMKIITGASTSNYAFIRLPNLNVDDISTLQVKLMAQKSSGSRPLVVGVIPEFYSIDSVHILATFDNLTSDYVEKIVSLESFPGTTGYIVIGAPTGYSSSASYHIDDVTVEVRPTCMYPTNFATTEVGETSVTLSWTELGTSENWNVEYGPMGFAQGNGTTVPVSDSSSVTIDNLDASTAYDFYVQSDCNGYGSNWVGPLTVVTSQYIMGTSGSDTITTCGMAIYDAGGPNGNHGTYSSFTLVVNPATEGSGLQFSGPGSLGNGSSITFYDGVGTSGTQIASYSGSFNASVAAGGPVTIVFSTSYYNGSGFELIAQCTDCFPPANVTLSDITMTGVTASWSGSASEYAVYAISANDTAYATTSDTSYTFTTLTSSTNYRVYVRSLCGSDSSLLTAPVAFNTACDQITITADQPWFENFEGYTGNGEKPFVCWETPVTDATYHGPFVYCGYAQSCHSGSNSAEFKGASNLLVLPEFSNDIHDLRLSFWATATSTSVGTVEVGVITNVLDPTSFEVIVPNAGAPGPRGNAEGVAGNGNYMGPFDFNGAQTASGRIALRYTSNSASQSWNLDDFTVSLAPNCPSPVKTSVQASNVDGHNATITFTDNDPDHNSWTVYYKPSSDSVWNTTVTNTTSVDLNNLDPETQYDVYVVTNCTTPDAEEDATLTIHFTTTVACPAPTNVTVSDIDLTSAIVSWDGTADSYTVTCGNFTTTATGNTTTITGLTSATTYTVSVVADCGVDGTSSAATVTFSTTICALADQCTYTFVLTDDYGDGWNGGSLSVQQNGIEVASLAAPSHGGGNVMSVDTVTVNLCDNMSTSLVWTAGSWASEASFTLIGPNDSILFSQDGMDSYSTFTFTTDCGGSGPGPVITDPTVTTGQASAIMQTTATLNGTITNPDNVTITAQGFEWKLSTAADYTVVNATGNPMTHNLTGLTENTTYTYRAFITFNGNTVYGSDETFTTLQQGQAQEPSATTAAATAITQTTATLNGSIANPDNVTITAQGFEWKQVSASNYTVVNATGATMTSPLTGLTANTGYIYRAFVTTANGTHYGADVTFTTLEEQVEPCDVPTGLDTTNVANEVISITWDANANVVNWNVRYRPENGTWTSATANTNGYTITGLTGSTTYEIQVQANCGDGNASDWSASLFVTTKNVGINSWLENSVNLYPNPAKEYVDIRIDGDVNVTSMEVYDAYGKLINSMNVVENPTRINVSNLANGMYFVRVNTEAGAVTKTFVKK